MSTNTHVFTEKRSIEYLGCFLISLYLLTLCLTIAFGTTNYQVPSGKVICGKDWWTVKQLGHWQDQGQNSHLPTVPQWFSLGSALICFLILLDSASWFASFWGFQQCCQHADPWLLSKINYGSWFLP